MFISILRDMEVKSFYLCSAYMKILNNGACMLTLRRYVRRTDALHRITKCKIVYPCQNPGVTKVEI